MQPDDAGCCFLTSTDALRKCIRTLRMHLRHEITAVINGDFGIGINHRIQKFIIIFTTFPFVCPHEHILFFRERSRDVILRGEGIASRNGDFCAACDECAHKNRSFLCDMECHADGETFERFLFCESLPYFHQCSHPPLGDFYIQESLWCEFGIFDMGHSGRMVSLFSCKCPL